MTIRKLYSRVNLNIKNLLKKSLYCNNVYQMACPCQLLTQLRGPCISSSHHHETHHHHQVRSTHIHHAKRRKETLDQCAETNSFILQSIIKHLCCNNLNSTIPPYLSISQSNTLFSSQSYLQKYKHSLLSNSLLNSKRFHHSICNVNKSNISTSISQFHHRKDNVCYMQSVASSPEPTNQTSQSSKPSNYKSKPKLPAPKPQSLRRLLSLAATEKWAISGGIGLLTVSSAITMSVPFVIGSLIDTIYGAPGSTTGSIVSIIDVITGSSDTAVASATVLPTDVQSTITATDITPSHLASTLPAAANTLSDAANTLPAAANTLPAAANTLPAAANTLPVVVSSTPPSAVASSSLTPIDPANLDKMCALLAGVFILGGAANSGRVYLMTTAGQRISQRLRSRVFSSLLRQETAYFDTRQTGELISRLAADTPLVATTITSNVADGLRSMVMATAAVAMMVYTSPELALFGLSVVPPLALLGTYHGRKLRSQATAVQERLGQCTQHAEERLSNLRTVRLFAQEIREIRQQDNLLSDALKVMYEEARLRAAFFGLTGLTGNMIILSVLYKGSSLVGSGLLTIGNLSAFLMYAAYVGLSVSGLTSAYSDLSKGAGAADRLFELIDRKTLMPLHGGSKLVPGSLSGSVEFRGVEFAYPSRRDAPVFSGLELSVAPGEVVAVVGSSGCGKSTVVSLLLRLYDPQAGSILLDGRDLTTFDPASLRAAIGVVTQDPILFSGSIRENLLYGVPDPDSVTDQQIEEAAHQANALSFVMNFPDKFETIVGERGMLLSGGQRQRLAIARAIITNPRLLCLDEATSALDSESEHLVQEAIERLMQGRTVLTIAHRLSTIRTADRIAVLQDGRVVEVGTYSHLLDKNEGIFRKLVSRQALTSSE